MNPLMLGGVFEIGKAIIERVWPDPADQARAQLELLKLQQDGAFKELDADLQLKLAQIELNKVEAGQNGMFKGGWRPAVGWVCAAGLVYEFLIRTTLPWILTVSGVPAVPAMPSLDSVLMELLFAMLGLGLYRSYEKTMIKK